jgi:hypothetical protein
MHPMFIETLAAERIRDMRDEAIASQCARLARRARRAGRVLAKTTAGTGTPLRVRRAAARHAG